ncbi:MAG: hypothetical protein LAN59_01820 [Acidobacteriia bacterium]|nr:hypothetical protein [Terriglobia bacterium]
MALQSKQRKFSAPRESATEREFETLLRLAADVLKVRQPGLLKRSGHARRRRAATA